MELRLDSWVIAKLSEPFEDIKFRVGGGSTVLAYIDSRQVVDRLNEVVGPENWEDSYRPVNLFHTEKGVDIAASYERWQQIGQDMGVDKLSAFKIFKDIPYAVTQKFFEVPNVRDLHYGGVECTLNILGTNHSDVGSPSYAEEIKGAYSDSLKRAAVKFGVGAYLYELKGLRGRVNGNYVDASSVELPEWALAPEKRSPDEPIKEMIQRVKDENLVNTHIRYVLDQIHVMGYYNASAPLIIKRYVYEELERVLNGRPEQTS